MEKTKVVNVPDLNRPDLEQHLQSIISYWEGQGYDYVNSHNFDNKMVLFFNNASLEQTDGQEQADNVTEELSPKPGLILG